jgi:RNA polymerase sigma-32 factor
VIAQFLVNVSVCLLVERLTESRFYIGCTDRWFLTGALQTFATTLGVKEKEVISMNRRMLGGGDASLNVQIGAEDGSTQWQDWLEDDTESQESSLADTQEHDARMDLLQDAMADLNDRERDIFMKRRLSESPLTLEELAKVYGVSRERIRQIEARAFEKIQKAMVEAAGKTGLIEAD